MIYYLIANHRTIAAIIILIIILYYILSSLIRFSFKTFNTVKKIQHHITSTEPEIYWKPPLTRPEQILYHRIVQALPDHIILAQVSFGRFLYANSGTTKKDFALEATFRQKVVDFLVCDKAFNIIAAIELDDSSHNKIKDAKRDLIFNQAGIKIIRWNVKAMPNESKIRDDLFQPTG